MTGPTTEVVGIYGFSTNAMPPQGDYFMASMLAVPDFTHRTSPCNLISGVLRSSLVDLPESILLLVAKARQTMIGNLGIYRMCMWGEGDRYGLYPANKLAGISPDFFLKTLPLKRAKNVRGKRPRTLLSTKNTKTLSPQKPIPLRVEVI